MTAQKTESAEYHSFKSHYADLFNGIQNPVPLSVGLYAVDLLSRDTKKKINELQTTEQKVSELLDATDTVIRLNSQNFYKFIQELEKDRLLQHLCDKLKSTCVQLKLVSSLPPSTISMISTLPSSSSSVIRLSSRQSSLSPPPKKSVKFLEDNLPSSSVTITSTSRSSPTAVTRSKYKQYLKKIYRQPLPDDDKLLTTASKHYIELAVISKEGITSKQADEFTRKSLHGLTEEILREKAPIELKHILKPREDGTSIRCVLVEGAPGIGKSTLAWEVCHKWEELESVKQYELVVLVRLREKKAQEAHCLEDILSCNATTNMKELLAAIGEGEGILIICDGFDELPHEQRQMGSVYIDLLKGRLLPEATIIVTSRPSVSAGLWKLCRHNIHRHLEVIGFTKKVIKEFAESVFSGDILEGFLSYITSNPPVYGMMYIPLNAIIVALIYQDCYDTDIPFPSTMAQLFDALTRALIRRHLVSTHQVPSEYCMPPSLQCTEEISKLPSVVAQQLRKLAEVAYESLCKNKYIFNDFGEDFQHLGIMKKTTSVNVCTGPGCSYSFLHLTLLEYLAALHIAIVNPNGFKLVEWLKRDTVVVRFLAGIFRHNEHHSHPVYQELVQQLFDLMHSTSRTSLQLVHCAYECPSIMDSIEIKMPNDERAIKVRPEVHLDWYATGYCMSRFNKKRWSLLTYDPNVKEEIGLLVKGLRSSVVSGVLSAQLESLDLLCVCLNHDDEVILQQLIAPEIELRSVKYSAAACTNSFILLLFQHHSIRSLVLHIFILDNNAKLQPSHSNTSLQELIIFPKVLCPLVGLILNSISLTYLEIADRISDSDLPVLTSIVQSHPSLEILQITGNNVLPSNLLQLIEAGTNSQLKKLRLHQSDYDNLPLHMRKPFLETFL